MDKELLIKVLGTNNRVIIPSFGAFLRKQQGEALVFTPFLKSDDGFLSGVLCDEYGVSVEQAQQMIEAFAEHIRQVMITKSRYYIDGMGTLIVDDNGAISFVIDITRQIPAHQSQQAAQQTFTPQRPQQEPLRQAARPINAQSVQPAQPIQPIQPVRPAPQPIVATPRPVALSNTTAPNGFTRPQSTTAPFAQPNRPTPPPNTTAVTPPAQQQPQQQQPQQQQSRQRPVGQHRNAPKHKSSTKGKSDIWLVVAIIAALVVIALMMVGILTSQEINSLQV